MQGKSNTETEFTDSVRRNFTEIHLAVYEGKLDAVERLLQSGVQVNTPTARHEVLPIHIAAAMGHLEIVRLLVKAGSHIDVWANAPVSTPLQLSCKYGHAAISRYLLYKGANPDLTTANILAYDDLLTPLTWCVIHAKEDLRLIKKMLKKASPNFFYLHSRYTSIHCAVEKNRKDILLLLFEYGANLSLKDKNLHTPLVIALKKHNQELFQLLLVLMARRDAPTESIFDKIDKRDFVKYNTEIPGIMTNLNLRLTLLVQSTIARQEEVAHLRSDSDASQDKERSTKLLQLMVDSMNLSPASSLYHLYHYLSMTTKFLGFWGKPKLRALTSYCFDLELMKAILQDPLTCRELGLADYLKVIQPQDLPKIKIANYSLEDAAGQEKFRTELINHLSNLVYDAFYPDFDEYISSYSN